MIDFLSSVCVCLKPANRHAGQNYQIKINVYFDTFSKGVLHLWHTARNEAFAIGGKGRLITSLYLHNFNLNYGTSCPIPWFSVIPF